MVRQPKDLEEAKQIFREEKAKFTGSASAIAGSRWLMAILATLTLAFGSHLIYAPERLPPVAGFSVAQSGLPPSLDFGLAGEQMQEMREAALREDVPARVREFVAENQERIPIFNWIGFGVAFALLLANMWIMTKRRTFSRG